MDALIMCEYMGVLQRELPYCIGFVLKGTFSERDESLRQCPCLLCFLANCLEYLHLPVAKNDTVNTPTSKTSNGKT